jgi:hypothetical protein
VYINAARAPSTSRELVDAPNAETPATISELVKASEVLLYILRDNGKPAVL